MDWWEADLGYQFAKLLVLVQVLKRVVGGDRSE
jgi:hypothetical protein